MEESLLEKMYNLCKFRVNILTKKKGLILLGVLFTLLFVSQTMVAEAHTPGPMTLEYDMETDILTVTVTHSTSDVNSHYIYEIVVEKNSVQVDIETYTNQSSASQVGATFTIAAVEGDVLRVTAKCSVSGQISDQITVADSTATTTTTTIPLPDLVVLIAGFIVVIGIVLVLVVIVKRR
jgi:hypothetical protein